MRALVLLLILCCASLAPASAETLITSLSNHRVLITSNYTGTSIAIFGAIERDAQTIWNWDVPTTTLVGTRKM